MGILPIIVYVVIGLYLVGMMAIGGYFYRRQRDTTDYFLAGRSMKWLPVALSMAATDVSAITFIGAPAYSYQKNLMVAFGILALPLVTTFIVIPTFLRFYRALEVSTAYEYLELRFNSWVRSVASLLFILWRVGWVATAIYVPAIALSQVTGISLFFWILVVGICSTIYTSMGGMKAVIWTDVVQWLVMVAGIVSIGVTLSYGFDGGIREIWQVASEGERTAMFNFSIDPTLEISFWAVIIGFSTLQLAAYGTDQVTLQRYLTTKNLTEAKRSIIVNALNQVPFVFLLYFIGIGLFAFYQNHPGRLDLSFQADLIIPFFVVTELPNALAGLVIAGIIAATMSSISSGVNSVTTATIVDFYRRHVRLHGSERHYLKVSRFCAVFWGVVATVGALYVDKLGTILEIIWKIQGFFTGVVLGIFLLGMFTGRANWQGVILGALSGMATVIFVAGFTDVSYLWYAPIGALCTLASGYLTSHFFPPPVAGNIKGLVLTKGIWDDSESFVRPA